MMGDDLAAALAFTRAQQRVVAKAQVVVHPPRTLRNLLRIRERALVSTEQMARAGLFPEAGVAARTTRADLLAVVRPAPLRTAHKAAWFVTVTVLVRRRAARRLSASDFQTWQRDDSSRQPKAAA